MNLSDINVAKPAMKAFADCVRIQIQDPERLKERIKDVRDDKALCEMIEPKNQAIQHETPKSDISQSPAPPVPPPQPPAAPKKM